MPETDLLKREALERMQKKKEELKGKLDRIKYKVAVYSGKGGVGKTTVAVNLAVFLARQGKKVGFLDADIDCPNAHILFGIKEKTEIKGGLLIPVEKYGVKVISMSMLVDDDAAIMWRGPMLSKAVSDFLLLGDWSGIDYLVIDIPPGTSDAPITIMQLIPSLTGFVAVTTPQKIAMNDMKRSINMIGKTGIPVLGIVENMCSDVFGCSKQKDYLAHIPLDQKIASSSDDGTPIVIASKKMQKAYTRIAEAIERVK